MLSLLPLALQLTLSAQAQPLVLETLANLPPEVLESSGLQHHQQHTFWTHNDSGNSPTLYCIDTLGTIVRTVYVNAANFDWEDLAKDPSGNLYIADIGNNANDRTNLRILRITAQQLDEGDDITPQLISIAYADQSAFPPAAAHRHYDAEALVWHNDSLHVFTKDRSSPHAGITRHYTLPASPGSYSLHPRDTFTTGSVTFVDAITAADISEDGQTLVLLNAHSIFIFSGFSGARFFDGETQHIQLSGFTQKEAICHKDGMLYITDEQSQLSQGHLYRVNPVVSVRVDEHWRSSGLHAVYTPDGRLSYMEAQGHGRLEWEALSSDGRFLASGRVGEDGRFVPAGFMGLSGLLVVRLLSDGRPVRALVIRVV